MEKPTKQEVEKKLRDMKEIISNDRTKKVYEELKKGEYIKKL